MIQNQKSENRNDWIAFIHFLIGQRRWIGACTAAATLLAAAVSLLLPNRYTAKVTLLPMENNISSLEKLTSMLPLPSGILPGKNTLNTANNLTTILKSYTLSQTIIDKLHLQRELYPAAWDTARQQWKSPAQAEPMDKLVKKFQEKILQVDNPRNGPISINVEMRDPQLAALTAEEMIKELQTFINKNVLTVGKKQRIFIENQLAQNKIDLTAAEEALRDFEQKHQVFSIESQTKLSLEMYSALKSKLIDNSVSLAEIEKTYGHDNPSYQKLVIENEAIRKQIRELEKENPKVAGKKKTNILGALDKVPELKLQYLRLKREALVLEKVFELLKGKYEIAKAEELRDEISFQVIDKAHRPEVKSSPRRSLIVLFTCLISALLATGLAYIRQTWLPEFRAYRRS